MKLLNKIKNILRNIIIVNKKKKKLTNKDFTVISSNCNGAIILNELNQRFNSPTVNLFFEAKDYIKFLENLDYYIQCELIEIKYKNVEYPLGRLDDINIHFMHYSNFEEAKEKWVKRCKRINKNNLFIMMTDRDGCNNEIIYKFDKLSFENKVIFVSREMKEVKSAFYIKGFEESGEVGELSRFKNILSLDKYYDQFDYVSWFNQGNKIFY